MVGREDYMCWKSIMLNRLTSNLESCMLQDDFKVGIFITTLQI